MNKYIYFRDRLKQAATIHDIPQAVKRQLYAKAYCSINAYLNIAKRKQSWLKLPQNVKSFRIFLFVYSYSIKKLHFFRISNILQALAPFQFTLMCGNNSLMRLIDGSPAGDVPSPFCLTVPLKWKNRVIKICVFGVIILSFFYQFKLFQKIFIEIS